ncbi:Roadkill [Operophtera brumata]|uniref:Roadkill n=1 Tax=Operophtera brumata TaxID=104452 RepID=A0A0L7LJ77_OPEBR|nr:Roadkill [Operophtera brumata]
MEDDNSNRYTYTVKQYKSREEQTQICNIIWKVPLFKRLLGTKTMSRDVDAPKYTVVEAPDSLFKLKVCFLGINTELMEIYYLATTTVFVSFHLEIEFGKFKEKISKDCQTVQANEWQYCATINNPGRKEVVSYHAGLQLSFTFKVAPVVKAAVCHNTPRLSEDLGTLLTDASYSDVTMKSAEGIQFRVHKNVLAVRSEVLRAHFEHKMRESISNVVETPWEAEVLRDVLTYVYTDKVPQVDDAPDKLLAAADYYQLMGLKSICEEVLHKRLTVENAIDTLLLAELHSANSLRQSTLEYIKNGRAVLVSKTESWANIQSVEFIKRIYDFMMAGETSSVYVLATALHELIRTG